MRHYNFFYATIVYSHAVSLYETNFPYKGGHSIVHSIFKTCVQRRNDHFGLFLKQKHVVEEVISNWS